MTAPCDSPQVLDWVLRTVLESSALVVLAWILERTLLRRRAAVLRQGLWLLVFARLVVPPLVPLAGSAAELAGALASPGHAAVGHLTPAAGGEGTLASLLLLAWGAIAAALLARLMLRARAAHRLILAHSRPAGARIQAEARAIARAAGLRRTPRLRSHDGPLPALVLGIRRPVILLAARLEGPARTAALWHECVHLRRRDPFVQAALEVLHALWWFHPLLGLAKRRASTARELACDAAVLRLWKEGARSYRRVLLSEAARRLALSGPPGPALALLRGPAALRERLEALEPSPGANRPLVAGAPVVLVAGAALLAACGSPRASDAPSPRGWWNDVHLARAEVEAWRERRPGLGCTTGRLVYLRALALEQEHATSTNP